jgi:hypothetical protein
MKSLVETTTDIFLIDPLSGDELAWNRPSLIRWTSFVDTRTGLGQIKVLKAGIPDKFTDADFLKFWNDSDQKPELAIASFLAHVEVEVEAEAEAEAEAEIPLIEIKPAVKSKKAK